MFGENCITSALPRLNDIHKHTENIWNNYVGKIPNGKINYLLIAESPPWSLDGPPQYVLDPHSRSRTLLSALHKTFIQDNEGIIKPEETINSLANNGFLIADSIPFSMNYLRKRTSKRYEDLVSLTTKSYLLEKLWSEKLNYSPRLTIAFSVKNNALAILKALGNKLHINGISCVLGEELIGVNRAYYPDAMKLRSIFRL